MKVAPQLIIVWRLFVVGAFLAGGISVSGWLAAKKKAPAQQAVMVPPIPVDAMTAHTGDTKIELPGFGTIQARTRLMLRPQVSGEVLTVHPNLLPGRRVDKGDLLLTIDEQDFRLQLKQTEAEKMRVVAEIARLQREIESTEALLAVRKRGLALSEGELARQNSLLTSANVGTQAAVERATQAVIADQERIVGHEGTLAALPRQINVLKAQLATFEVAAETFRLQISRCTVLAPFSARVVSEQVEPGDVVSPTAMIAELVDDRVREITVALDFADARRWLHFSDSDGPGALPRPVSTRARIRWVDAQADQWQSGAVERIASFDPRDRQIGLIIVLEQDDAPELVEGMFCEVRIPGKIAEGVVRLPRIAVTEDSHVYVLDGAGETRDLRRVAVSVVRDQGELLLVSGLATGDVVVINRMTAPAPGVHVQIRKLDGQDFAAE
ncbi:MAG TPA: hypothetical protein DCR55_11040 [Lentisphaeria bacterium]|nr:hypothetical protein [Lentisphaeria bacterium]